MYALDPSSSNPLRAPPPQTGAIAVVLAIIAALASIIYLTDTVTIWSFMQEAVTVGTAVMTMRFVVEFGGWIRDGHLKRGASMRHILLRPFTVGRLATMSAISLACDFTPVEPLLTVAATVVLVILARCSTAFERNIRPKLEVQKFLKEFLASVTYDDEAFADGARTEEKRATSRLPRWVIRCWRRIVLEMRREEAELRESDTIRTVLYYLRAAPLIALIAVFCSFGSAAGLVTNPSNAPSGKTATGQSGASTQNETASATPAASSGQSSTGSQGTLLTAGVATESTRVVTWNGECSNEQARPDVSARVVLAFDKLFETESGLEPRQEGCVRHIAAHNYGKEFYASAFGVDPVAGTHLSYALDSERYGGIIVLWAASSAVETLVAQLGPVGGAGGRFPDYEAGEDGDYYLLKTPRGIYALTRQHRDDEYLVLTPMVARAWLGAMNEVGEWLWPSEARGNHSTIQLSIGYPTDRKVAQITVNATTGEARRGKYRYPASPVKELSLAELQALAPTG